MRRRLPAAALAAVLVLSGMTGCNSLLKREVYEESPHVEHRVEEFDSSDLIATSVSSLKNTLIQMVRAGMSEGTIRLVRYQGDPERDLFDAAGDVLNEEPIGKYAVYYIKYDQTQVLTNYHVSISINYRRTPEQIASVVQTSGSTGFKEALTKALSSFAPELTVELPYYDEASYDPQVLLNELYYENPDLAVGYPEMAVTLYPDTGPRRIVEIEMEYPNSQGAMRNRASMAREAADNMLDQVERNLSGGALALRLRDMVADKIEYDYDAAAYSGLTGQHGTGDAWNLYGALVLGRAAGEGYALAFKRLCDLASVPCRIVFGEFMRERHAWNIVRIGGEWYHADVAADDMNGSYGWFLKNDSDMLSDHTWEDPDAVCMADSIPLEDLRPDVTAGVAVVGQHS